MLDLGSQFPESGGKVPRSTRPMDVRGGWRARAHGGQVAGRDGARPRRRHAIRRLGRAQPKMAERTTWLTSKVLGEEKLGALVAAEIECRISELVLVPRPTVITLTGLSAPPQVVVRVFS